MARLTRKDMQQQNRERLLAAAECEIAAHGVEAASIRGIAETAGFTLGAFYSNFESKEAMLLELLDRHMQQELQDLHTIVTRAPSGEKDEILDKISSWLLQLRKNNIRSSLEIEFSLYAKRVPSFRRDYDRVSQERLTELADNIRILFERKGRTLEIDPLQMAVGFAALWSGFAIQGDIAGAEPVDQVILIFLRALLGSASPVRRNAARS